LSGTSSLIQTLFGKAPQAGLSDPGMSSGALRSFPGMSQGTDQVWKP
jgi:hypothetical protein